MARKFGLPANVLGGSSVATRPIQVFKDWSARFAEAQLIERVNSGRKRSYPALPENIPASVPQLSGTRVKGSLGGSSDVSASNSKTKPDGLR